MNFRLFGFPVHVEWTFFLLAAVLGYRENDPAWLVIWLAVVFVSVLVHELGHAVVCRRLGLHPSIVLHGMGGETRHLAYMPLLPRHEIAISLAGPGLGLFFGMLVYLLRSQVALPPNRELHLAIQALLWANIAWGILNLIPMLPLDGGKVMAALIRATPARRVRLLAEKISLGVAVVACVVALSFRMYWGAMLCAIFALSNYRELDAAGEIRRG